MILGALILLAELTKWEPHVELPLWFLGVLLSVPFLLSGAVTMLVSRRFIGVASAPTLMLKRVLVLASVCFVVAFLIPCVAGLFVLEAWTEIRQEPVVLESVTFFGWWLSWVIGGVLASLPRSRRWPTRNPARALPSSPPCSSRSEYPTAPP
jgi:hypothetical protein